MRTIKTSDAVIIIYPVFIIMSNKGDAGDFPVIKSRIEVIIQSPQAQVAMKK
jgi:hypothetical protein